MKVTNINNLKLKLIKNKKFKTIDIRILIKDNIKKEEITLRNFLFDYLLRNTKKYKTKQELSIKLKELYSASLYSFSKREGNILLTTIGMTLLNPKYSSNNIIDESIELLNEILLNPCIKNNQFDDNYFDIIKHDLLLEIESFKENLRPYSIDRMLNNMNPDEVYSYSKIGYIDDLNKITPKSLYEYYNHIIKNASFEVYIMGDFNYNDIINIFKDKFKYKFSNKKYDDLFISHNSYRKKTQEVNEVIDYNQSKLAIGCKFKDLTEYESKYVTSVYNLILGGSFTSKLMQVIREKLSLCYYINSNIVKTDNLLIINSGISKSNYDKVIKNVKKILNEIKNGKITDNEINIAKKEIISSLDTIDSTQNALLRFSINKDMFNLIDIENYKEIINKVTIEDIITISKKVYIDTIFLLEGGKNEA